MPSTSVHFPVSLLEDLDHFASERGVSRNRLIVEACRLSLRKRQEWPGDFFDDSRFSTRDLEELRATAKDFEEEVIESRHNRSTTPF